MHQMHFQQNSPLRTRMTSQSEIIRVHPALRMGKAKAGYFTGVANYPCGWVKDGCAKLRQWTRPMTLVNLQEKP